MAGTVTRNVEFLGEDNQPLAEAPVCEWFARCDQPATNVIDHPILGHVPTCTRCVDKYEAS